LVVGIICAGVDVVEVRLAYPQLKIGLFVSGSLPPRHRPEIWPQEQQRRQQPDKQGEVPLSSEEILFLRRTDVIAALAGVDTLDCVKRVLIEHAAGRSSLPEEGYSRGPTAKVPTLGRSPC
jgi:hypothetical protein